MGMMIACCGYNGGRDNPVPSVHKVWARAKHSQTRSEKTAFDVLLSNWKTK